MAPFFGTLVSTAENIVVQVDVSVTTKLSSNTSLHRLYSFKLIMENVLVLYQETKEIVLLLY